MLPSAKQTNSPLPQGQRCLYLDKTAIRQPVGPLQPRTRYELSVSIATSLADKTESKELLANGIRECEVGLMTQTRWLVSKKETLPSTPGFKQFRFELAVPEQIEQNGDPIFLALSAKNGTVFFDQLQLSQLSVAR